MAKIFVFPNTFTNTLNFSYKNCDSYNQYIHDIYIHIYIHIYIDRQIDRQRKNERLTRFKGYGW